MPARSQAVYGVGGGCAVNWFSVPGGSRYHLGRRWGQKKQAATQHRLAGFLLLLSHRPNLAADSAASAHMQAGTHSSSLEAPERTPEDGRERQLTVRPAWDTRRLTDGWWRGCLPFVRAHTTVGSYRIRKESNYLHNMIYSMDSSFCRPRAASALGAAPLRHRLLAAPALAPWRLPASLALLVVLPFLPAALRRFTQQGPFRLSRSHGSNHGSSRRSLPGTGTSSIPLAPRCALLSRRTVALSRRPQRASVPRSAAAASRRTTTA